MRDKSNSPGWEAMEALPQRRPMRDMLIELQDSSLLLLMPDGRVLQVRVLPAPDGDYELQRSGKVAVRNGLVREVRGVPEAPATAEPSP